MKRIILGLALFIGSYSFSQTPEAFKYQAVVRDAGNNVLTNQAVGFQLKILQGSPTGSAVYTETFSPTTNAYGLVNLEIGTGTTVDDFSAIDWANGPYYLETGVDVTGSTSYAPMGTSQLVSVPYALHAKSAENVANDLVDDADADPTNEYNTGANLTGTDLNITDGGGTQTVDLSSLQDGTGTDDQNLTFTGTSLTIEDGNTVDLSSLQDGVNDADADPTNEYNTGANLTGTNLNITDGGGTQTVDLSSLQDGVNDADSDPTNEYNTGLSLVGTNLTISDGGGNYTTSLSSLQDGTGTDDQNLSLTGTNLTIEDGNTVDLSSLQDGVDDADNNPTNELQNLTLSGNNLTISSGNTVTLPAGGGTDDQNLTFIGTNLTIEDGNTVNLASLQDGVNDADADPTNEYNTGISLIGITGTTLAITDGGGTQTVDLGSLQDGVDDADNNPLNELQNLTLSGNNLTISSGNTVTLPNTGDNDWVTSGINQYSGLTGNVGVNTTVPASRFHVVEDNTSAESALLAEGFYGPTIGQLGVQGNNIHLGVTGLNIAGDEVGVLGVSTGGSTTDNYGVYGFSNGWGGHFENQNGNFVEVGGPNATSAMRISDGNEAVGFVLTSDAFGNASWQAPASASDNDWTISGSDMYSGVTGNVGVNTTTPTRNFHLEHDQFTAAGGPGGLEIEQTFNGARWTLYSSQSSTDLRLYFNDNPRGAFSNVSGNYTATSDRRLKKNIETIDSALSSLMELRPTVYHFNEQSNNDDKIAGFIAQEVKEVLPGLVKIHKNDSNGKGIDDLHMISYSEFTPYIIKGMQEQQQIIDSLKSELEALKKKVEELEK